MKHRVMSFIVFAILVLSFIGCDISGGTGRYVALSSEEGPVIWIVDTREGHVWFGNLAKEGRGLRYVGQAQAGKDYWQQLIPPTTAK